MKTVLAAEHVHISLSLYTSVYICMCFVKVLKDVLVPFSREFIYIFQFVNLFRCIASHCIVYVAMQLLKMYFNLNFPRENWVFRFSFYFRTVFMFTVWGTAASLQKQALYMCWHFAVQTNKCQEPKIHAKLQ